LRLQERNADDTALEDSMRWLPLLLLVLSSPVLAGVPLVCNIGAPCQFIGELGYCAEKVSGDSALELLKTDESGQTTGTARMYITELTNQRLIASGSRVYLEATAAGSFYFGWMTIFDGSRSPYYFKYSVSCRFDP
jgi:hypothetical protein